MGSNTKCQQEKNEHSSANHWALTDDLTTHSTRFYMCIWHGVKPSFTTCQDDTRKLSGGNSCLCGSLVFLMGSLAGVLRRNNSFEILSLGSYHGIIAFTKGGTWKVNVKSEVLFMLADPVCSLPLTTTQHEIEIALSNLEKPFTTWRKLLFK